MLLGLHYVISRRPKGEDDPVFLIVEGYREVVWMPLLPDFTYYSGALLGLHCVCPVVIA